MTAECLLVGFGAIALVWLAIFGGGIAGGFLLFHISSLESVRRHRRLLDLLGRIVFFGEHCK